jgi:hypothetical protein
MPRHVSRHALLPKSLAEQNADFTSEGAPSPGRVADLELPKAAKSTLRHAASRTPAHIPGAHRRAPTGRKP